MTTTQKALRYTTHGDVRGMGPLRDSLDAAERDLERDRKVCAAQGGYSDRHICYVDSEGWLYSDEACERWVAGEGGRSSGGIKHPDA